MSGQFQFCSQSKQLDKQSRYSRGYKPQPERRERKGPVKATSIQIWVNLLATGIGQEDLNGQYNKILELQQQLKLEQILATKAAWFEQSTQAETSDLSILALGVSEGFRAIWNGELMTNEYLNLTRYPYGKNRWEPKATWNLLSLIPSNTECSGTACIVQRLNVQGFIAMLRSFLDPQYP